MKTFIALMMAFCVLFQGQSAVASAMPIRVNNAISGSMNSMLVKRGFAANDPRFENTIAGVSNVLGSVAGTAAAVTVGAVTAPGWASIALAAGIGAVVTYGVTLGINGLVNWLFHSDSIDQSGASLPIDPSNGITAGGPYWMASTQGRFTIYGGDPIAIGYQLMKLAVDYVNANYNTNYSETATCTANSGSTSFNCSGAYTFQVTHYSSGAPATCVSGTYYSSGACYPYTYSPGSAVPNVTGESLQQAMTAVPSSDLNKPLNPVLLSAIIDQAWKQAAAQPGYQGLPYQEAQPVTSADVQPWLDAHPSIAPSVEDFVSPNPTTSANTTPFAIPSTASTTSNIPNPTAAVPNADTVNPASSQPQVNLGADPGTPQPTLETTPTASDILSPILNLMPDLRSFQMPAHASECPKPEFDVWGSHFVMDAHCTLINSNQGSIAAAFNLVWAILALFIVLSA
jgi:hypothetical protein